MKKSFYVFIVIIATACVPEIPGKHSEGLFGLIQTENACDTLRNEGWRKKRKISFNVASIALLSIDTVPIFFNTNNINYSDFLSNGQDLRFISSDCANILEYEIETWNENGNSLVWLNLSIKKLVQDEYIYMIYSNDTAQSMNYKQIWDSSYIGVWHLNQDPSSIAPQFQDSSIYSHHGTMMNFSSSIQTITPMGKGLDLPGANEYINITHTSVLQINADFTFEAYLKVDTTVGNHYIFEKGLSDQDNYGWFFFGNRMQLEYRDTLNVYKSYSDNPGTINASNWLYLALTYQHSNREINFYINGILSQQLFANSDLRGNELDDLIIGAQNYGAKNNFIDGIIDEIRISKITKKATNIATQYLAIQGGLINIGAPESF